MKTSLFQKKRFLLPVIALVIFAAYLPAAKDAGFVWDDDIHVVENRLMKPVTAENVIRPWKGPYLALYIPVTYTGWAALSVIGSRVDEETGEIVFNPRVFHVADLALHILCAWLVFAMVVMLTGSPGASFFAALFFALHPVQVEAAVWVSELKTLLSALFSFSALALLISFHKAREQGGRAPGLRYVLALGAFFLALLSKPMAVVVPFFVLFIQHFFLDVRPVRNARLALPWFALVLPVMWLATRAQPPVTGQFVPGLLERFLIAGDTAAFYLSKLFLPVGLGPDYGRTPQWLLSQGWGSFSWMVPAAVLILLILFRKRAGFFLGAYLIFLVGFVPVSGLVPFVFQLISTVADRYLYLSMLGPALALGVLLARVSRSGPSWFAAAGALVLILGLLAFRQAGFWENERTLWVRAYEVNSRSAMALNNLAETDDRVTPERMDLYRTAVRLAPDYRVALKNMAVCLLAVRKDNPGMSLAAFAGNPDRKKARALLSRANEISGSGDLVNAVGWYGLALLADSTLMPAYHNLGVTLFRLGDCSHVLPPLELAAVSDPENPRYQNDLGVALVVCGDREQGLKRLRRAAALAPEDGAIAENLDQALNLGDNPAKADQFRTFWEEPGQDPLPRARIPQPSN